MIPSSSPSFRRVASTRKSTPAVLRRARERGRARAPHDRERALVAGRRRPERRRFSRPRRCQHRLRRRHATTRSRRGGICAPGQHSNGSGAVVPRDRRHRSGQPRRSDRRPRRVRGRAADRRQQRDPRTALPREGRRPRVARRCVQLHRVRELRPHRQRAVRAPASPVPAFASRARVQPSSAPSHHRVVVARGTGSVRSGGRGAAVTRPRTRGGASGSPRRRDRTRPPGSGRRRRRGAR